MPAFPTFLFIDLKKQRPDLADARTAARIGASLDVKRPSDRRT
jgi:hypothetical protein